MALTNAERQLRWRERHIRKRRNASRLANLLMRVNFSDAQITEIAFILNGFFNRGAMRMLRRELRQASEPTESGVLSPLEIRLVMTERTAWEADHPGETYPEHECSLSDRPSTDLARWRRQRERKARRGKA